MKKRQRNFNHNDAFVCQPQPISFGDRLDKRSEIEFFNEGHVF